MAFQNDVVGGITLVRPAIRSADYVPGVSGWSINRDGSAEFSNVTTRGPVVVMSPTTGEVLASIGANGNVSGQVGSFTDVLVGNQSLAQYLTAAARGIVGYWDIGSGALPAPGNGTFTNLAWVRSNFDYTRVYRVTTRLLPMQTSSTTYQILTSQWIYTNSNIAGNVTFGSQVLSVNSANFGGTQFPVYFENIAYFADTRPAASGGRVTWQLQTKSTDANTRFVNGGWGLIVDDIGPLSAVTTYRDGGTGTASGATTYTKTYYATSSRSYDSNGNPIPAPDGNNNVYQGSFPDRSYGNESSLLVFPGAQIRSDLSGAVINSAKMSTYCIKAENTAGTLQYDTGPYTSPPSTLTGYGPFLDYSYAADWPVPGWYTTSWLDQNNAGNNTTMNEILTGNNAIVLGTTLGGSSATGFAAVGAGGSTVPSVTISYSK